MPIIILTEAELRQCVMLDLPLIDRIADGFAALARDQAVMPPVLSMAIEDYNGEVDVKTAYVKGFDSFAIKISPGFFDNPGLGLPSLSGLMVLLSARTGQVEALLLDNGYLTDLRTAAAGAVAARALSPDRALRVGVLGAGLQARLQIQSLLLVRPIDRLTVWARNADQARRYADEMHQELDLNVEVAADPQTVVVSSDTVITTTPATSPLIEADWLHPGLHITAMGSDADYKNELAPGVLAAADRFVCDRRAQSLSRGEWRHAVLSGDLPEDAPVDELGEIVAGAASGRRHDDEITVCDLTGTGVQDTAIALYAYRAAAERGFGTLFAN